MSFWCLGLFFFFFPLSLVLAIPFQDAHDHGRYYDSVKQALPDAWYRPAEHPIHSLFRRDPEDDGVIYAPVGSPEWSTGFPRGVPDVTQLPRSWVDAFNQAKAAGKIPNIPKSYNTPGMNPVYPTGYDPRGPDVCSSTYKCRAINDIWDAPTGVLGTGFDDGPYIFTDRLLQFLHDNNERATHFMIGVNILNWPSQFTLTYETMKHDIAVHTWTHPYLTTLDDLQVVAQFGWTMQLIHNSTGGRVPKYWRPPYGDADNRIRAIAKEVFGLEMILWNQDSGDWNLSAGRNVSEQINSNFQQWLTGPKTPGLIVLEHELSDATINVFMTAYPIMKANGWDLISVAQLGPGGLAYQNADEAGSVHPTTILAVIPTAMPSSSSGVSASTDEISTISSRPNNVRCPLVRSAATTTRQRTSSPWTTFFISVLTFLARTCLLT